MEDNALSIDIDVSLRIDRESHRQSIEKSRLYLPNQAKTCSELSMYGWPTHPGHLGKCV
jgi:hypothetical protein